MDIARTSLGDVEYRRAGQGSKVALVFHGGHMHAGIHLGYDYFVDHDYTVIAVSRPGYGRTPLSTGTTPDGFADALNEMLRELGIQRVVAVGISAGGRSAMRLAARHPGLVDNLVLQSSVSFAPWPDAMTRLAGMIAFNPLTERFTWALIRKGMQASPRRAVTMMLSNMTTLNAASVTRELSDDSIRNLAGMFSGMRSGRGFLNDLRTSGGDASDVLVPTLIIHSRYDKSVPLSHSELLARQVPDVRVYLSDAESHLIWFSPHYAGIRKAMRDFLGD
jgi:pimeloyl-ACP methyl ester carboxylesterase